MCLLNVKLHVKTAKNWAKTGYHKKYFNSTLNIIIEMQNRSVVTMGYRWREKIKLPKHDTKKSCSKETMLNLECRGGCMKLYMWKTAWNNTYTHIHINACKSGEIWINSGISDANFRLWHCATVIQDVTTVEKEVVTGSTTYGKAEIIIYFFNFKK